MGILLWIVFGLIAGIVAKWIMPGRDPGGIIVTILLGIGGAMLGGLFATAAGIGGISGFDIRSLIIAIAGAMILLFGYRFVVNKMIAWPQEIADGVPARTEAPPIVKTGDEHPVR